LDLPQFLAGLGIVGHLPGDFQLHRQHPVVLLGQVLLKVTFLVHTATLDQRLATETLDHRFTQGLGSIQDKQIRMVAGQPAFDQIVQQGPADLGVLRGARPQAQHVFTPFIIEPQSDDERKIMELLAIEEQSTEVVIGQRSFQQLLERSGAGGLPVSGYGTLLDPLALTQIVEHPGIVPCRDPPQNPLRDRLLHATRMGKGLIT
jgi:hypothetical protein